MVVGIEILAGTLNPGCRILKEDGKVVGRIKGMQSEGENIKEAKKGDEVALAIEDVTIGRQLSEGDVLYPFISLDEIKGIDLEHLDEEGKALIKEIKDIQRKK